MTVRDEKKKTHLYLVSSAAEADDTDLAKVAARIRPLPHNVTPSEEFLRRTRLQLLQQEPAPRQAA